MRPTLSRYTVQALIQRSVPEHSNRPTPYSIYTTINYHHNHSLRTCVPRHPAAHLLNFRIPSAPEVVYAYLTKTRKKKRAGRVGNQKRGQRRPRNRVLLIDVDCLNKQSKLTTRTLHRSSGKLSVGQHALTSDWCSQPRWCGSPAPRKLLTALVP